MLSAQDEKKKYETTGFFLLLRHQPLFFLYKVNFCQTRVLCTLTVRQPKEVSKGFVV
jgi:hypothetical protein